MQDHDDFAFEPIPGIPAPLPHGEKLLWQGSPDWKALARRPFRCRLVALYLSAWIALQLGLNLYNGQTLATNLNGVLITAGLGVVAVGILLALAWATAKVTVYSITSARILIRFGIALQITMNLPFKQILSADLACDKHGIGDLPLTLADTRRVGYFVLWPHVQALHLRNPRPMLRALPDAASAAHILAEALHAWHEAHPPLAASTIATGPVPENVDGAYKNRQTPVALNH